MIDGPRLAPASGKPAKKLVVLVHGFGSDGADLIPLGKAWASVLPDAAFVAPNAPWPCVGAPTGLQWFPVSVRNPEEVRRGVAEAEPLLQVFLDQELARLGLTDADLALVGFSQGAMLALYCGPHRKGAIAGIVSYSGMIAWSLKREQESAHKPPILLIHGDRDTTVPSIALPATRQALIAAGFPVESHLCAGLAHGIDTAGEAMGAEFLVRVLGGESERSTTAAE